MIKSQLTPPVFPLRLSALFVAALLSTATAAPRPGDFDLTFHDQGWTTMPTERNGFVSAMAVQSDGKLVFTGKVAETSTSSTLVIYRVLPDGSFDPSFHGTGAAFAPATLQTEGGVAVAVQPDGKIIAFGGRQRTDTLEGGLDITLVRFLPDGNIDPGFGADSGSVTTRVPQVRSPGSMVLQPDGKILVSTQPSGLLRFLPNGTLDESFGTHGLQSSLDTGGGFALTLQSDGKILTAGAAATLYRLLPNGTPDASFGTNGRASLTVNGPLNLRCLSVLSDGRILAAGDYAPSGGSRFFIARFLPNGTPDLSFNATGWNDLFFFHGNPYDIPLSLLVQEDGRILLAGLNSQGNGQSFFPLFARFHSHGALDTGFGSGGWLLPDFNSSQVTLTGAALLPGGRLLTTGTWAGATLLIAHFDVGPWPGLSVEQQPGTPLTSLTPVPLNIGPVVPPSRTTSLILRNTASNALTDITLSLADESHPGEIAFTPPPVTTLAPGAQTSITVTLTPSASAGSRSAKLHIASIGSAHSPFILPLTGSPATGLEMWRVTHFGYPESSGPGADAADPDHDGIANLVEFGVGTHPLQRSLPTWRLEKKGADYEFIYTRNYAATEFVSWVIESGYFPDSSWVNGAGQGDVISSDGTTQTLKAFIPGNQFRYFVRLRATRR